MIEFTGERVIPGEVNPDLWAEHFSRYAFATRFTTGNATLDVGCGAGYGTAELGAAAVGVDVSIDAVRYAREKYASPKFCAASALALPFRDATFSLVTAFEVIEHLTEWRILLSEARRVIRPDGIFLVSTPNKLYYDESRAQHGPNPFHEHEFEFEEFQAALAQFFPHVTIYLQNWNEVVSFAPVASRVGDPATRIDCGNASPDESNFFVALCSIAPQTEPRPFSYLPSASNLLRDRQHHIRSLDAELKQARAERNAMIETNVAQKQQLEESNRWARQLEIDWKATLERIAKVQDELQAAQTRAGEVAADYACKVGELELENRDKTEWALETERRLSGELIAKCAELAEVVRLLEGAENTVIERTEWAQRAQDGLSRLDAQMKLIRDSRWIKLGRSVGLGPKL